MNKHEGRCHHQSSSCHRSPRCRSNRRSNNIPFDGEVVHLSTKIHVVPPTSTQVPWGSVIESTSHRPTCHRHPLVYVKSMAIGSQRSIRLHGEGCTGLGAVQDHQSRRHANFVGFLAIVHLSECVGITIGRSSGNLTTVGNTVTITVGEVFAGIKHAVAVTVGDRSASHCRDGAVVASSVPLAMCFVTHTVAIAVGAVCDRDIQTALPTATLYPPTRRKCAASGRR